MTTSIKGLILRLLEERGYVLLKKQEYAELAARAHQAGTAALHASVQPPSATLLPPFPTSPGPAEFGDVPGSALRAEAQGFMERAQAVVKPLPAHAPALYAAVRYLNNAGIEGDITDCGEGTPATLTLAAMALSSLRTTRHRLVMFDVTADPRHRPEAEMLMWGSDFDHGPVANPCRNRPRAAAGAAPKELLATGYPSDNIQVVRYPVDAIDLTRPIAFLGLTSETYEANRAAIRALFPRLRAGGVLAVEGGHGLRPSLPGCVQHQRDAVTDYLAECGIKLQFWQVGDAYRLAVKP